MTAVDRWVGGSLVLLGLAIGLAARSYEVGFAVDPLGPRALPYLVAALFILGGGVLVGRTWVVWRGTRGREALVEGVVADLPRPGDTVPRTWPAQLFSLGVLIVYALSLPILGFVASTALASGALSRVFAGRFLAGLAVGLAVGLGLFSLFTFGFGLELPAGLFLGGGP